MRRTHYTGLMRCALLGLLLGCATNGAAQTPSPSAPPDCVPPGLRSSPGDPGLCPPQAPQNPTPPLPEDSFKLEKTFFKRFGHEELRIFTSPKNLRLSDATWLVPLAGVTGGLLVTDVDGARHLPGKAPFHTANTTSDLGVFAELGIAGLAYAGGRIGHNQKLGDTGWLAGEAALHTLAVTSAIKYSLGRQRPLEGSQQGYFFHPGSDSFPSQHAAIAWAVASTFAHQYESPLTSFLAYGAATAVSLARVGSRKHFATDVLVGSTLGYLIGRDVSRQYKADSGQGNASTAQFFPAAGSLGSPYEPLDSWVYPVFDRLIALGLLPTAITAQRPWTRLECARMLQELEQNLSVEPRSGFVADAAASLHAEFANELRRLNGEEHDSAELSDIYARVGGIAGSALNRSLYFGTTEMNDFGRPFGEGFNSVEGASASLNSGRFSVFLRGEFQRSGSIVALPASTASLIAANDTLPSYPTAGRGPQGRFRMIESYLAMNIANNQVSFGKQAIWWGPARSTSMMLDDNAEPISMFRINRVSPLRLPPILAWLGPLKYELFLGELGGHDFFRNSTGFFFGPLRPHPYIHGERFTFKPTRNFEFGFSETTLFSGPGYPLTLKTVARSYGINNTKPGLPNDPGDRRSGFEISYRPPVVRDWMTVYADSMIEDEFSPVAYPQQSSFLFGLYASRLPMAHKVDFRVEGGYSDPPQSLDPRGISYFNFRFLSGYTNQKALLASWLGRSGQGIHASSTLWVATNKTITVAYMHREQQRKLFEGGRVDSFSTAAQWALSSRWGIQPKFQVERWNFPALAATAQTDLDLSISVTYRPKWRVWR